MNKLKQTTTTACRICFLLLLLIFAMPVLAIQNSVGEGDDNGDEIVKRGVTIYGVVIDKKTDEPLIGASVAIWVGDKIVTGVSTDIEGAFRLVSEIDDFELHVSYIGYKDLVLSSNSRKLTALRI